MRTTSSLEAYNGVLNKSLQNKGGFFGFVHDIRSEVYFKHDELNELIESGSKTERKRKPEYLVISMSLHVIH